MNKNVLLLLVLLFVKLGCYAQGGMQTCWDCVGCNENSKLVYDQNKHNDMAIGNDGTVFVAYIDSVNKPHVKKYNGVGWDIVGGIIGGFAERVSLALDPSGKPYIFTQEWGTRMGGVSRFNGTYWELVGPFRFTSPTRIEYPSIDISSTGEVIIAYESYNTPEANSIYVQKFDGTNWVNVGEEFTTHGRPAVKFDGADNLYLASLSSGITIQKLVNNSWTTLGTTSANLQTAYPSANEAPDLSFDNNDVPYIGYSDVTNQYRATVKKFDGANWVVEGTAGFSPAYSGHVRVAFDSNNSPYAAFMDGYSPSYEGDHSDGGITVMKYNGSTWELVGSRLIVPQMSIFPGIVIDKAIDKPYVVFLYRPYSNDEFDRTRVYSFNGTSWQWLEGESSGGYTSVGNLKTDNAGIRYISRQSEVLMYDGGNWQSIPANTGLSSNIIFDNANALYRFYYESGTYPNYTVVLDKYTGSGWTETGRLASAKSYSFEIDPMGVPHVLYSDALNKMTLAKSDGSGGWITEKTFSACYAGRLLFDNESNITIACLRSSNNRLKLYKIYAANGHTDSLENTSMYAVSDYTMAVDRVSGVAYIGTITSPNGIAHFSAIRYNGTAKQDLPFLSAGADNGYTNPHFSVDKNGILHLFAKYPGNESGNSLAVFRLLNSWYSLGSYVSIPPAYSSSIAISPVSETIDILLHAEGKYFVKSLPLAAPPTIEVQPNDTTICSGVGNELRLTCTSPDDDVDYLWQVDKGDGFGFITLGDPEMPYFSTRGTLLRHTSPPASLNNYRYRCLLNSDNCQATTVSDVATLLVNETPTSITILGSKSYTCIGEPIKFYIANANGTNVTFQWRVKKGALPVENLSNDATYAGVNTDTLTILNPVSSMHGYDYTCQMSNMCKTIVTNFPKPLYIYAPDVTTQPVDKYVCGTSATSFTLVATGSGLSYRWQLDQGSGFNNLSNSAPYSGTTTATLSLSSVSAGMNNYKYRCIVTNATCPADTSVIATLYTNPGLSIISQPANTFVCSGVNTSLSVGASGGGTTTYSWREDLGSGFVLISNGSVYSGQGTSTLTITNPTVALNGRQYRCVVTRCGSIVVTSATAVLTVGPSAPAFTMQPLSKTACEGLATTFTLTANGGVNYKWQANTGSGFADLSNDGMYSGTTTATLALSSPDASMNGYTYRCEISNSCGAPITSNNATLTVIPNAAPAITSGPSFNAFCAYGTAIISVGASGTGLTYSWQVNTGSGFTTISGSDFNYGNVNTASLTVYNVQPSFTGYQYRCIVGNACGLTATSTAAVMVVAESFISFHTPPSNVTSCPGGTATFSVGANGGGLTYQWQLDAGSGFTNISESAPYSGTTSSQLTITGVSGALSGYKYRCVADNSCASPATSPFGTLTVTSGSVSINSHPSDKTVCAFLSASFTVGVSGTASAYRWQVNTGSGFTDLSTNSTYGGTSGPTLVVINAFPAFSGYLYRCVIDPACGGVTSNAASLTVLSIPTVSATATPSNSICAGAQVTLTGNGANSYTWNHGVTDGVAFTPANTQTYTVTGTGANNCTDTENIVVTVSTCNGVDEPEQTQGITITPNPSLGNFYLNSSGDMSGMQLDVYDSKGTHILTKTTLSDHEILDLSEQQAGIYQARIMQRDRVVYNARIVKQ